MKQVKLTKSPYSIFTTFLWVIVFIIFFITFKMFADNYITGTTQYKMQDGESLGFAKENLHYLCYRDILSKELTRLSLDANTFWQKYDAAFSESFAEDEARHQAALSVEKNEEQKKKISLSFKELELRRRSDFAGISHVIISEAIKNFGASSQDSMIKSMTLQAKVNYKALRKLYSRFMIDSLQTKSFSELIIKSKFDWDDIKFDKIGVVAKEQLELSIQNGWKDWFVQNIVSDKNLKVYNEFEAPSRSELSRASLYISVRAREDQVSQSSPIRYQVSLALEDNEVSDFIFFNDIPGIQKNYERTTTDESRKLMNDVWSIPIPYFVTIRSLLEKTIQTGVRSRITVRNYKNIDDVLSIQDSLKTVGISINLLSYFDYFDSSHASLTVRHNGDDKALSEIIKKVQNDFFPAELLIEQPTAGIQ